MPSEGPIITDGSVLPRSVPAGTILSISANISDPNGVATPDAHIQSPDESNIAVVPLILSGLDEYSAEWSGLEGIYYVDIFACDLLGNCSEAENI